MSWIRSSYHIPHLIQVLPVVDSGLGDRRKLLGQKWRISVRIDHIPYQMFPKMWSHMRTDAACVR